MSTSRRHFVQSIAAGGLSFSLPATVASGASARLALRGLYQGDVVRQMVISPVVVHSVSGDVRNVEALVRGGQTTIEVSGKRPACIVLDYGRVIGGLPTFEVSRFTGNVEFRSIYAQALPWLLPSGDGPAPGKPRGTAAAPKEISFVGCAGGVDLARVECIALHEGRIVSRLIQGGQRFQALEFRGSGTLSLQGVGFIRTFRAPRRSRNQGSFECSDKSLGEIWMLGAYALDVASLPAGSIPAIWDIGPDGATVYGDTYTGYQRGLNWTDYTARFSVRIDSNEASWLVRAQLPDGIRFVLCSDTDELPQSTPNTLRIYQQFSQKLILTVKLVKEVREHEWYQVETAVKDRSVRVKIDGVLVAEFEFPSAGGFWGNNSAGWVALANASGAIATFRDLEVKAADGSLVLRTSLKDRNILDEFLAGTNTVSTIVDGATRDRQLFTGDLGVAAQTLLCSSYDCRFLRGSIDLFSRYQNPNGAIATSIPPQANPRVTPGNAFTEGIKDYTVQHVSTIFTYWWYTGDTAFLKRQWPVVVRVLEYLHHNIDPVTGLFSPLPLDPREERVAEALPNIHYFGVLEQAATMSSALGETGRADGLRAAALQLRNAINVHLFNRALGLYGASTANMKIASEHANAYSVLFGVVDDEASNELLARLANELNTPAGPMRSTAPIEHIVCPYTVGYDVQARFAAGDTSGALALIRRAWRHMQRGGEYYSGATWEYVGLDGRPGLGSGTSLAHPWSSGPTSALSAYVLGIRPLEPGFSTWLIEPQPSDLGWARGAMPTPQGPLRVRWARTAKRVRIDCSAPTGTGGFVGWPLSSHASHAIVNGKMCELSAEPGGYSARRGYGYVGPLCGGSYEILLQPI